MRTNANPHFKHGFKTEPIAILMVLFMMLPMTRCKQTDTRVVRINNVMCRAKPDINSKVVEIFNKGKALSTKPTNIQFTFINITDVWHEVPQKNCFIFGGLLAQEPIENNSNDKAWIIRELHKDPHGFEANDKVTFRAGHYTKSECDDIIKQFKLESARIENSNIEDQKRKKADCERRGIDPNSNPNECGNYLEGTGDLILTCVQK